MLPCSGTQATYNFFAYLHWSQDVVALDDAAKALGPGGPLYMPFNIALIVFFNYYYTFLQVR